MKKQLLAGAFVLASFFAAQAQVSYSFETSEGYAVGPLATDEETGEGQNGWSTATPFAEIVSTESTDGDNSLFIGTSNVAQTNPVLTFSPEFTLLQGVVTWSFDAKLSAVGADASTFNFSIQSPTQQMVTSRVIMTPDGRWAYIDEDENGTAGGYYLGTVDGQTFTPFVAVADQWYSIRVVHHFDDNLIQFYVDDVLLGESVVWAADGVEGFVVSTTNLNSEVFIDNLVITNLAGVNDNVISNLSVFPNPANDVVNVTVDAAISNITVTDLNGRTVKNTKFAGVSEASVNVSDLSAGVYMMNIASDKGSVTKKIVKN